MEQVNVFFKGVSSDISPERISSDQWVFPSHNIRVYNKRGQGFIVTTNLGKKEFINLGEDKYILAAEEHNNIIYFIVVDVNNNVEIGTYPYLNIWTPTPASDIFVNEYGVIKNFNNSYFITNKFGYTPESNVKLIIDDAFDESANLYLCDGIHTDKVVNVGFRRDGSLNGIVYTDDDFHGKLNHIPYSLKLPVIKDIKVSQRGRLKAGQYHLFFAYKTKSFDTTEFTIENFPINVAMGETILSTYGTVDELPTNKKISFKLDSWDASYEYLSIGVLRIYGSGDGNLNYDEYIIAKNFKLNSDEIQITGEEQQKILTNGEIFNLYLKERISKDHIFKDSRIWKVNMTKESYGKALFNSLSQKVTLSSFVDSTKIAKNGYENIVHNDYNSVENSYYDPSFIYTKVGYFNKEIYPFGIVYLLKSGIITEPYPIRGYDEVYGQYNDKGLFRPSQQGVYNNEIIGININAQSLIDEIDNNNTYSDIKGFYIVRGERIKNFLYEGLMTKTANGVGFSKNRKTTNAKEGVCWYYDFTNCWFAADSEEDSYHVPVFKNQGSFNGNTLPKNTGNNYSFPHATFNDNVTERYDTFLPDVFMALVQTNGVKYEYSLAVPNPKVIPDDNDWQTPGDSVVEDVTGIDAIDTKLYLSDNRFAIFSPDFMTEVKHLTENGSDYYIEVKNARESYTEFSQEDYSFKPDVNMEENYPSGYLGPVRTRVFEVGTSSTQSVFNSGLYEMVDIYTSNVPDIRNSNWKPNCFSIDIAEWDANKYYHENIFNGNPSSYSRSYFEGTSHTWIVRHNGQIWHCVRDVINPETGDSVVPGDSNVSGNIYWELVYDIKIYSQEYAPYFFKHDSGESSIFDDGHYVLPSCTNGEYLYPENTALEYSGNVKIYNVDKGTHKGRGRFCSYAEDGKEYKIKGKKGLYSLKGTFIMKSSLTGVGKVRFDNVMIGYNRSYQTPGYLGVHFDDNTFGSKMKTFDDDQSLMATVYLEKPDNVTIPYNDSFFKRQLTNFTPEYTKYAQVSDFKMISGYNPTSLFKGDSFSGISWWRLAHHLDFDDNPKDGYPSSGFQDGYSTWSNFDIIFRNRNDLKSGAFCDSSYSHGILYGLFSRNRRNVFLRSELNVVGKNNVDETYTFFPHILERKDPFSWIYASSSESDVVESLNINDGYNITKGFKEVTGIDLSVPYDSLHKKCMIAVSNKHMAESFQEGYRVLGFNDFQNFSTNYGAIIRVAEIMGTLITIRENGTFKHYVGQKKLTEDLGYAESSIYLSDEERPLIYYGLQDWHAFVKSSSGVYFIDVKRGHIVLLKATQNDQGNPYVGSLLLDKKYSNENKLTELISLLSERRISPVVNDGISLGYNPSYDEVYFTFLNGEEKSTLVFNENLNFFLGTSGIIGSVYINLGNDFFSFRKGLDDENGIIYQEDVKNGYQGLSNSDMTTRLSFIVNGLSEKENTVILTKIFESLKIISPHIKLSKIKYETDLQTGEYIFRENSQEFWKDSEWIEGEWNVPVIHDSNSDSGYYNDESLLRGKWLKITLEFPLSEKFYISEIISMFNLSFS